MSGDVHAPTTPHSASGAGRLVGATVYVAGRPLTDVTALVGTAGWAGLVAAVATDVVVLGTVDLFVAFALLALVPLGLGLVSLPAGSRLGAVSVRVAVFGQLPAAVLAVAGLATPVGSVRSTLLVVPWLCVTLAIALVGLARLAARRRLTPLTALSVDAALLYVPVGAAALVAHRAAVSLRFAPIIVLLTAVHYHYAGFVLPLVAGRAGERLGPSGGFGANSLGRIATVATLVIIANLSLVAVGITFSPLVEVVAVALLTVAVAGFAAVVLRGVVPAAPRIPGALLGLSSIVLFVTMALALAYGYSAVPGTDVLVTIEEMVAWHGTLNAFGFALPALVALRLLDGPH